MWQTVLDLIYTGHSDLAWKFMDAAGPKAQQSPCLPWRISAGCSNPALIGRICSRRCKTPRRPARMPASVEVRRPLAPSLTFMFDDELFRNLGDESAKPQASN